MLLWLTPKMLWTFISKETKVVGMCPSMEQNLLWTCRLCLLLFESCSDGYDGGWSLFLQIMTTEMLWNVYFILLPLFGSFSTPHGAETSYIHMCNPVYHLPVHALHADRSWENMGDHYRSFLDAATVLICTLKNILTTLGPWHSAGYGGHANRSICSPDLGRVGYGSMCSSVGSYVRCDSRYFQISYTVFLLIFLDSVQFCRVVMLCLWGSTGSPEKCATTQCEQEGFSVQEMKLSANFVYTSLISSFFLITCV